MIMEITIGTDPEMFIYDNSVNHIISGHKYVPGTKHSPFFVPDGAVQLDGVAAEFNIFPAKTGEEFVQKIRSVQKTMLEIIHELAEMDHHPNPKSLSLVAHPTAYFTKEYFDALPSEVKVLGCQPDYNAWTGDVQKPSSRSEDTPFRTGGFHIHVGWTSDQSINEKSFHFKQALKLSKQLDCAIFIPSKLWDNDDKRRELYGARGSFRPKHYGMEYRSLSNAVLNDDELLVWLFDTTKHATDLLFIEGISLFEDEILSPYSELISDPIEYLFFLNQDYGFPLLPRRYIDVTVERAA